MLAVGVLGSYEIKRHLLLGRKVMPNLDSIFKSRDITLFKICHSLWDLFVFVGAKFTIAGRQM